MIEILGRLTATETDFPPHPPISRTPIGWRDCLGIARPVSLRSQSVSVSRATLAKSEKQSAPSGWRLPRKPNHPRVAAHCPQASPGVIGSNPRSKSPAPCPVLSTRNELVTRCDLQRFGRISANSGRNPAYQASAYGCTRANCADSRPPDME
jgi:hypothetical protein